MEEPTSTREEIDGRQRMITVRGAAENNLQAVDVDIPHNRITVVTGVSGSGKSSLVFDVIYQEARRRYLESFSTYARQFMGKLRRPHVAHISGLAPAIAVGRQSSSANPRSTVGTLTEIYDYLRLLYARLGDAPPGIRLERRLFSFNSPHGACPACNGLGVEDRIDPNLLIADPNRSLRQGALRITTPNGYIIYSQVTIDVLDHVCRAHGFSVDIPWKELTDEQKDIIWQGSEQVLIPYGKHPLESRMRWKGITAKPREEGHYKGILPVMETILRQKRNKNILRFARSLPCGQCAGLRLSSAALSVMFRGQNIAEMNSLAIAQIDAYFRGLDCAGPENAASSAIREAIIKRTTLLIRLGLGHLTLSRESTTLSGGDIQRIRLATQAGNGLRGVLYVLDEPSAGLHPAETEELLSVLASLRDNGNTIIMVEHDDICMRFADHLIDIGPHAGVHGGRILWSGSPEDIHHLARGESSTRDCLAGDFSIIIPTARRIGQGTVIVKSARTHNLKNIDAVFKLAAFNVVTGVSGAGKSTLVKQILVPRLSTRWYGPGIDAEGILVDGKVGRIIEIDQSPIGRTPRSNPATYTGVSDDIRDLFAALDESLARGWDKGKFSFNVKGGRCETCEGAGLQHIGMHFLGDVDVICPDCEGRRFSDETLKIRLLGKNIFDVLDLSIEEATDFFQDSPSIRRFLEIMLRLGLGYLKLGQSSTTLSGGEAQRLKLAAELGRPESGHTIYILDEPTTGLHLYDIKNLLIPLNELVDKGNTIIAIEHHPDFIKMADHVIDIGPGSGERGGRIVAMGTPEEIAKAGDSLTGRSLRCSIGMAQSRPPSKPTTAPITLSGVTTNNLRHIDVQFPFNRLTVVTGPSGSGKSSLVFETLFTESLERYIESFSTYVRSLVTKGSHADLASSSGLTPPIAISQKTAGRHPRSTVGTMTEVYDYYRLLYSRAGNVPAGIAAGERTASHFSFNHEQGACCRCKGLGLLTVCDSESLVTDPSRSLVDGAMDGTKTGKFYGEPYGQHVAALKTAGTAAGIDFSIPYERLDEKSSRLALHGSGDRTYDIVWSYRRLARSGDFHFKGPWKGFVNLVNEEYERKHADNRGEAILPLMKEESCPDCSGHRLKPEALAVRVFGMNIAELAALSIHESIAFFGEELPRHQSGAVIDAVSEEILRRLWLIRDVGLGYLSLDRASGTLSSGEAQRLRLAGMLGARLTGLTYVLDEPTTGLHPRDTFRLVGLLKDLTRQHNTVVVVEHDPDIIRNADYVIDIGPGAGRNGGRIVADGSPEEIISNPLSITGRYLADTATQHPPLPGNPRPGIHVIGACANNLKHIDVEIPFGGMTVMTGVSGSGKSSLVFDVLLESAKTAKAVNCSSIKGLEQFHQVRHVDREPLRGGSTSMPITFTGLFEPIRSLFAATADAQARGFKKPHFSCLTKEGGCEACGGAGIMRIKMDFLADVVTPCEDCHGKRYKPEILEVAYEGINIAGILGMTVTEATVFFSKPISKFLKPVIYGLSVLDEIGLGYLQLGQPLDTLSGGEAQRLRLVDVLLKPSTGPTLFLFDEPTTGLHFKDTERLLTLFGRLIEQGHTIIVIEHNLDVISRAHHVIDLGPEGGDEGGAIITCGTAEEIAACKNSHTGRALLQRFKKSSQKTSWP